MKIKGLLVLSVSLIFASYFMAGENDSHNMLFNTALNVNKTKNEPTGIREKIMSIDTRSETVSRKVDELTTAAVEKSLSAAEADTPDEIWEQQFSNNTVDEFPAIESEYAVVTEEMKIAEEAFFSNSNSEQIEVDNLIENEFNIDDLPPSFVDYAELMPIELQESERLFRVREIEGYEIPFTEPLTDPFTGLSDQEINNMGDQLPASEVYDSVD